MTNELNEKHQKAVREWMDISDWDNPHDVTLTFKKFNLSLIKGMSVKVFLEPNIACDNFRRFLNFLNRSAILRAAYRSGHRLKVFAVMEESPTKHLHYHAAIECPVGNKRSKKLIALGFEELVKQAWLKTLWGDVQMEVKSGTNNGWIDYITKKYDKYTVTDGIDWTNVHL